MTKKPTTCKHLQLYSKKVYRGNKKGLAHLCAKCGQEFIPKEPDEPCQEPEECDHNWYNITLTCYTPKYVKQCTKCAKQEPRDEPCQKLEDCTHQDTFTMSLVSEVEGDVDKVICYACERVLSCTPTVCDEKVLPFWKKGIKSDVTYTTKDGEMIGPKECTCGGNFGNPCSWCTRPVMTQAADGKCHTENSAINNLPRCHCYEPEESEDPEQKTCFHGSGCFVDEYYRCKKCKQDVRVVTRSEFDAHRKEEREFREAIISYATDIRCMAIQAAAGDSKFVFEINDIAQKEAKALLEKFLA